MADEVEQTLDAYALGVERGVQMAAERLRDFAAIGEANKHRFSPSDLRGIARSLVREEEERQADLRMTIDRLSAVPLKAQDDSGDAQ